MPWALLALANTALDALGNIIDSNLANRVFKDPRVLLFFLAILDLIILPVLFIYRLPQAINLSYLGLFALVGFLDATTYWLYIKALREDDTSIVASLFSLGKVSVPFIAFFLVGERLSGGQYLGFIIVVLCSSALTLRTLRGRVVLSKALLLMGLASIANSFSAVVYKLTLQEADWVTAFTYLIVFNSGSLIIFGAFRFRAIRASWGAALRNVKVLLLDSALFWLSRILATMALSIASVTLIKGIYTIQPIFVLGFAAMFKPRWPEYFRENITAGQFLKKSVLFIIIILTLIIIVRGVT